MVRSGAVVICCLLLLGAPAAWSKDRQSSDYPNYEPTPVEDLPGPSQPDMIELPSRGRPEAPPPGAGETAAPPEETAVPEPPAAETGPAGAVSAGGTDREPYEVWIWQENGDSLSRIAEKVYGDRTKWRLIYMANKDVIKDPDKIYPKQKLRIPPPDQPPEPAE